MNKQPVICTGCRNEFEVDSDPNQKGVRCPKCGKLIPPLQSVPVRPTTAEEGDEAAPLRNPARSTKSRRKWPLILVASTLLVAGGVAAYFLFSGSPKGDPRPPGELDETMFAYIPGDTYRMDHRDYVYARKLDAKLEPSVPTKWAEAGLLPEQVTAMTEWSNWSMSENPDKVAVWRFNKPFDLAGVAEADNLEPSELGGQTVYVAKHGSKVAFQPDEKTIVISSKSVSVEPDLELVKKLLGRKSGMEHVPENMLKMVREVTGYPRITAGPNLGFGGPSSFKEGEYRAAGDITNTAGSESYSVSIYLNDDGAEAALRTMGKAQDQLKELAEKAGRPPRDPAHQPNYWIEDNRMYSLWRRK